MSLLAITLTALLALASPSGYAPQTPPSAAAANAAPAGWEGTRARIRDLLLAGNNQGALGIAEKVVATSPRFADGHFWLGSVNENIGRALAQSDPRRSRTHFETAAAQFRQGWALGGGQDVDAGIRGLIDLYEYAIPSPDLWKTSVMDAVSRFPGQPAAHWYHVQLILRERRTVDLDAAFRSARAGLPSDPPDGRVEFAVLLTGLAEKSAPASERMKLLGEARAIANEILKSHPSDRFGRRARSLQEEISRLQSR